MTLQKIVPIVLLVSLAFTAGLLVDLPAMLDAIKRVGVLITALIANFVVVPALAVLVTRAYQVPDPIASGILLMAMAPGVPFIMLAGGRKKGGSLELAIALTFVMAALSTLTIPFTARLLLREASGARIPLEQLAALGLFQLLPLILGAFLAARRPAIALAITPFFKRLTAIGMIALLVIVLPQIVRSIAIVYGSLGTLAMLTIVILSLATGWLAGGRQAEYRHTLAMGTALRNPGSAAVIASLFKSPAVEAAVATYFIVQFVVSIVAGEVFKRASSKTIMDEGKL